jgi:hypothetical protein
MKATRSNPSATPSADETVWKPDNTASIVSSQDKIAASWLRLREAASKNPHDDSWAGWNGK